MSRPMLPSDRQRLRTSANLWRALIPLVVVIAVALVLAWPRGPHADGVHVVDLTAPLAAAREQAGFPMLAPVGLVDWRPTSTEFVPAGTASRASFRVGWVTPKGRYAEFVESDDAADAVAATYGPLTADAPVDVGGVGWDGFRRSDGRQLIRHVISGVTVLVTGSAPQSELVDLARALR